MDNLNLIKEKLAHHYGGETIHMGFIKDCWYSEGVNHYYQLAQCYWLHDIIQTEIHKKIRKLNIDVYYMKIVVEDSKATITVDDYQGHRHYIREIKFTDHPDGEMNLIIGNQGSGKTIICLPQEN